MCKVSADSEDSSQIFLENSYISAKCLEIIYRYFTDRRKPIPQITAVLSHICYRYTSIRSLS